LIATLESSAAVAAVRAATAERDWSGPFHERFRAAYDHQRRDTSSLVEGLTWLETWIAHAADTARDQQWQRSHAAPQGGDVALAARARRAGT
jgi:uncharacterized protein YukE